MKQLENSFEIESSRRISFSHPKMYKQESTGNLKQEDDKSSENNTDFLLKKKHSFDSFNSNIQFSKNEPNSHEYFYNPQKFPRPVSVSSSMSKGFSEESSRSMYS